MAADRLPVFSDEERAVYSLVATHGGLKASEIGRLTGLGRSAVSRLLFSSPLMRELCYQDDGYRWHALVRQDAVHEGLREFSAWYGTVGEFTDTEETSWLSSLQEGCRRIGRSLNDRRGLTHSFLDCRNTLFSLFQDLASMTDGSFLDWEIAFELRMNRARYIRIYADVLVVTPSHVFSLEFKMKKDPEPEEVLQAAKYCPYLEVIFGPRCEVIPALVLTAARDYFDFVPIGRTDSVLPAVSGDMLFNVFNEYLGFLD